MFSSSFYQLLLSALICSCYRLLAVWPQRLCSVSIPTAHGARLTAPLLSVSVSTAQGSRRTAPNSAGAMTMPVRSINHSAEIALGTYKRAGFAVDPKDTDHIAAYCTMRQVSTRISPQSFMQQLKSQVKDIGAGTKFCMHFWPVPKASWQGGLPPAAADAHVPDDQLVDMELRGG